MARAPHTWKKQQDAEPAALIRGILGCSASRSWSSETNAAASSRRQHSTTRGSVHLLNQPPLSCRECALRGWRSVGARLGQSCHSHSGPAPTHAVETVAAPACELGHVLLDCGLWGFGGGEGNDGPRGFFRTCLVKSTSLVSNRELGKYLLPSILDHARASLQRKRKTGV